MFELRRAARKRDMYTCQKCGITEADYEQELSVHHIIPFAMIDDYMKANELSNLLSVCEPCHRIIHSGNNHPSKFVKHSVDDIV
ncbi:HNH endonuclease [Bacillus sp. N9]